MAQALSAQERCQLSWMRPACRVGVTAPPRDADKSGKKRVDRAVMPDDVARDETEVHVPTEVGFAHDAAHESSRRITSHTRCGGAASVAVRLATRATGSLRPRTMPLMMTRARITMRATTTPKRISTGAPP